MTSNIQHTDDYSSFKRIAGNRTINRAQVKKLRDSFDENPGLASAVPIMVNDKMEIVDGQHRFIALKQLGLPIWYYQVKGIALPAVQVINSATKNWNPTDYAKSFSELGNDNYKIYLDFKKRYHLAHHVLLLVLTDASSFIHTTGAFRKGKFKAGDVKKAHIFASRLEEMKRFYPRGDSRVFALAFKRVSDTKNYDHDRMIEKITACGSRFLKDSPYAEDYIRQLEKIYNHHMGIDNRVRLF